MRKLVFCTQRLDPADPVLAATVPMVRALAARVEELVVLCDGATIALENVRVHEFGAATQLARGIRFERALAGELRGADAVVAHMVPLYAVIAAPLVRPRGIPLALWYTHWKAHAVVRAAEKVCTHVLSVDERSFPLRSRKVRGIGHGIDLDEFACTDAPPPPVRALVLGRYSPAKGLETILRAVAEVPDVALRVVGPSLTEEERMYRIALERFVLEHGLLDRIDVRGPTPRHAIPTLYAQVDALVNDMRPGAADKVVYEAAATCLPVIASNPAFDSLLPEELRFAHGDVDGLAAALRRLSGIDRNWIGRGLREVVLREHSVGVWADRVVALAR